MARPISVPSEAIDLTPSDLWRIIWEEYPGGTAMPATVPKKIWDAHWIKRNPESSKVMLPPPPPPFLKGYWGKLRGNALTNRRKRKAGDEDEDEQEAKLPPVWPPSLSRRFWDRYFEKFPDGHRAPPTSSSGFGPALSWNQGQEPSRYSFVGSGLCVNATSSKFGKFYRASTGVDAWDKDGNWLGPG